MTTTRTRASDPAVWDVVAQAVAVLEEPFSRRDLVQVVLAWHPELDDPTVSAHIHAATANIPNRRRTYPELGSRTPLLKRVDRGLYRRWVEPARDVVMPPDAATTRVPSANGASTARRAPRADWFWHGNVQAQVVTYLSAVGAIVALDVGSTSRRGGTDVEASLGGTAVHVVVKGWPADHVTATENGQDVKVSPATNQARMWFANALTRALQLREAHPDEVVAIGLPSVSRYAEEVASVATTLAERRIGVLWSDERGSVTPGPTNWR